MTLRERLLLGLRWYPPPAEYRPCPVCEPAFAVPAALRLAKGAGDELRGGSAKSEREVVKAGRAVVMGAEVVLLELALAFSLLAEPSRMLSVLRLPEDEEDVASGGDERWRWRAIGLIVPYQG